MIKPILLVASALLSNVVADPVNSVTIDGNEFVYEGLAGAGILSGSAVDNYGDTISFGSSVKVEKNSITVKDGKYSFISYNLPDRGWNTEGSVNFAPRIYKFAVEFDPSVTGTTNLKFDLLDTILLKDPNGVDMTGLDCNTTMTVEGFPTLPASQYTGDGFGRAGDGGTRVCLDPESINLIDDNIENGFWITDEYGPLIFGCR
ncbi:unnamed protein product [[Candida] boidinii]|nr:unnamed protein product [[Candida] boidinii]